jgi:hypothetical protein
MRGDRVSYNGRNYESLSDNLFNVTPGTAAHWWKDLGPCTSASTSMRISTSQGVLLYPVPVVAGTLNIQTLDDGITVCRTSIPKSVVISDGLFRIVLKTTIVGDNSNVDLSTLAPGLYYIYIEGIGKPIRFKVE